MKKNWIELTFDFWTTADQKRLIGVISKTIEESMQEGDRLDSLKIYVNGTMSLKRKKWFEFWSKLNELIKNLAFWYSYQEKTQKSCPHRRLKIRKHRENDFPCVHCLDCDSTSNNQKKLDYLESKYYDLEEKTKEMK